MVHSRHVLYVSLVSLLCITAATSALPSRRVTLIDTAFTVEPRRFNVKGFSIDNRTPGGILGRFRAQGGSGNDIEVFVFEEDQFENWRNGHATPAFYSSGKLTVGKFAVRLPPGNYFLVFSNLFSANSNKAVTASVFVDDGL